MLETVTAAATSTEWLCRDRVLDLSRVHVMGILNVTPDSFSDGGQWFDPQAAVAHALEMASAGAAIIDIGGESTRPGAPAVTADEELRRVMPVIEHLAGEDLILSIDTSKAQVAQAALDAGAQIVNDVTALGGDPDMADVVAKSRAGLVLMHMQGTPQTMQLAPKYDDVVGDIAAFFASRREQALHAGISEAQIVFDPGIGFGKTVEHNLEILRRLGEFRKLGRPLAIGPSRKAFIGAILGGQSDDRLEGTAAAVATAVLAGAAIVRVHDVGAMVRVARMAETIRTGSANPLECGGSTPL